jgi:hypothetical protein
VTLTSRPRTSPNRLAFRFRRSTGAFVCSKRRASLQKYVSLLDQEKVGFPVTAYVSVAIEKSAAKLAAFERVLSDDGAFD